MLPPRELTLSFVNSETGKSYKNDVTLGQQIDIPKDMGKLIIKGFRNSADFRGHNIGETFFWTLTPKI